MNSITLYIPCHNARASLAGCLEAVLAQTLRPSEILVVNDGSTDDTVEIARKFPVRIVDLPSHPGLAGARNAAVKAASGEFVASLDADCIPDPRWLERLAAAMEETGADGAGGRLTEAYRESPGDLWRAVHMPQHWGERRTVNPPFLFGCNTLFREKALLDVGLYDPRFRSNGEDADISRRFMAKGYRLVYEPAAAVRHLKKDTVVSVLRADWNWGYRTSGDTEKYRSPANIVYHNFTNARFRLLQDLQGGRYRLIPVDLLLFLLHTYWDLRYAREGGLFERRPFSLSEKARTLLEFHVHLEEISRSNFPRTGASPCSAPAPTKAAEAPRQGARLP